MERCTPKYDASSGLTAKYLVPGSDTNSVRHFKTSDKRTDFISFLHRLLFQDTAVAGIWSVLLSSKIPKANAATAKPRRQTMAFVRPGSNAAKLFNHTLQKVWKKRSFCTPSIKNKKRYLKRKNQLSSGEKNVPNCCNYCCKNGN